MKNIYIFFVLLTYVTLNSFSLCAKTVENTSNFSRDTYNNSVRSSIIDDSMTVFAEHTKTSEVEDIIEFDSNQIASKTIAKSLQPLFIKPSAKYELINDKRLKIRISMKTKDIAKKQILLTIDENATDGIDRGYDAEPIGFLPNDIYWVTEGKKLLIQAFGTLLIDRIVPIGIKSMGDCSIQIKVDTIENPYKDMEIYLRDNATLDTYDIKNGIFEVTLDEGHFNDKYSVVFEPKVVTEEEIEVVVNEPENEEMTIEIDNTEVINDLRVFVGGQNEFLRIRKPEEMNLTNISMYNMLGQQIYVWNSNLDKSELNLPIYANKGVHLILMDTEEGRLMKKIIIK